MNNPESALSTTDPQTTESLRTSGALSGRKDAGTPQDKFPTLSTGLTPDEVIARLRKRSQQGKLPGFEHRGGHVFRVLAFGHPYDMELIGSVSQCPASERGSSVRFSLEPLRKLPIIMAITMALSIWPGVWITHSLLITYFESYPQKFWITAVWYVPLCVIALPALWKQYKRSIAAAEEHAHKTVGSITKLLSA